MGVSPLSGAGGSQEDQFKPDLLGEITTLANQVFQKVVAFENNPLNDTRPIEQGTKQLVALLELGVSDPHSGITQSDVDAIKGVSEAFKNSEWKQGAQGLQTLLHTLEGTTDPATGTTPTAAAKNLTPGEAALNEFAYDLDHLVTQPLKQGLEGNISSAYNEFISCVNDLTAGNFTFPANCQAGVKRVCALGALFEKGGPFDASSAVLSNSNTVLFATMAASVDDSGNSFLSDMVLGSKSITSDPKACESACSNLATWASNAGTVYVDQMHEQAQTFIQALLLNFPFEDVHSNRSLHDTMTLMTQLSAALLGNPDPNIPVSPGAISEVNSLASKIEQDIIDNNPS